MCWSICCFLNMVCPPPSQVTSDKLFLIGWSLFFSPQTPLPLHVLWVLPSLASALLQGKNLSFLCDDRDREARVVPIMLACPEIPCAFPFNSALDIPLYLPFSCVEKGNQFTIDAPCANMSSSGSGSRSWSISEDSLRRYVYYASENCIQELLSASDQSRADTKDAWKVLALDDGVEISKRRSGSLHIFRGRWLLTSVSPQQFITVANAIDAAKQWDSDLVEAKYIKDLDDNLSIICLRFGDEAKPLFKNREFIVYERRETMDDGTLVVAVASLPKEIAAGLHPKRSDLIRGLLLQSGWVVEKLANDSCMVTYVVQLDPAGWVPKCFVNRLNTKLVMIIDNLKKLAQACPINSSK